MATTLNCIKCYGSARNVDCFCRQGKLDVVYQQVKVHGINATETKMFIDSKLKSLCPQVDTSYTCEIVYCGQVGRWADNNVIVVQI